MQSDRAIGRYRRWYARLLRLYPRPFHERFGEPMAQTFVDLCRARTDANRGLHAFALGTFAETTAGIIKENLAHMTMQTKRYIRWVLITAVVLLVPFLVMQLNIAIYDPGDRDHGLNWGPMDFAILGVLVLSAGLLYEYASMRAGNVAQRVAVGIALLAGLGLVWVNLAVGMMDVEPGNLMYILVLAVALIGASVSRFAPREASAWMFVTAGAQAVVAVIALVTGLGPTWGADALFTAAWVASALLFRRAGERVTAA
jgi:hypothetical protein